MYHIFVCDDDENFLKMISMKVEKILSKNRIFLHIHKYTSAKNMIFDLQEQDLSTAIFFMDIVMPKLSGIEAAKIIREMDIDAQIIFVTSSKRYIFEALEVMPLHYFVKRYLEDEKFEHILLTASQICYSRSNRFFCYKLGHSIKRISVDKIVFFEVKNRVVLMYKTDGEIDEFYSTMKKLEEAFKNKPFVRIHRSYLANLEYLVSLEKKHLIIKNTILPIGEKYMENVRTVCERFVLNDINVR